MRPCDAPGNHQYCLPLSAVCACVHAFACPHTRLCFDVLACVCDVFCQQEQQEPANISSSNIHYEVVQFVIIPFAPLNSPELQKHSMGILWPFLDCEGKEGAPQGQGPLARQYQRPVVRASRGHKSGAWLSDTIIYGLGTLCYLQLRRQGKCLFPT